MVKSSWIFLFSLTLTVTINPSFFRTNSFVTVESSKPLNVGTPLVDFVGNWSNLEVIKSENSIFSEVVLCSEKSIFGKPTFNLIGNGKLLFNLTSHGYERVLPKNQSLLFHWKDFGEYYHSKYIGVHLIFRTDQENSVIVKIGKYVVGSFWNRTGISLEMFESPDIAIGTSWERWGISNEKIYDYFNTTTLLTLTAIEFCHPREYGSDYFGKRNVEYVQPLLIPEHQEKGGFLGLGLWNDGLLSIEPSTSNYSATSPLDFLDFPNFVFIFIGILVILMILILVIFTTYLFWKFINPENKSNYKRFAKYQSEIILQSKNLSTCLGSFDERGMTVQLKSKNCPFEDVHLLSILQYIALLHQSGENKEQLYGPFPIKQSMLPEFHQVELLVISFNFSIIDESVQDSRIIKQRGKVPAILLLFYPQEYDTILSFLKNEIFNFLKTIVPSSAHDFTPRTLDDLVKGLFNLLNTPK